MKRRLRYIPERPRPSKIDVKANLDFLKKVSEMKMTNDATTFEDLRNANLTRLTEFGHGTLEDGWNVAEWGNALAGETGELCNVLKKMIRQMPSDPPKDELRIEAMNEIADVAIYLDLLAAKLEIDLAVAIKEKFNAVTRKRNLKTYLF